MLEAPVSVYELVKYMDPCIVFLVLELPAQEIQCTGVTVIHGTHKVILIQFPYVLLRSAMH